MAKIVYTSGYPRNGSTWLCRLLSDLLDSPLSNLEPVNPPMDMDFCATGRGGCLIKKTHWQHKEWDGTDLVVFVQRDPRDVAISQLFYRSHEPTDKMISSTILGLRELNERAIGIEKFVRQWLADARVCHTSYELLHKQPKIELQKFSRYINNTNQPEDRIDQIIARQSFKQWANKYPHSMRKGVVGDWRNFYKQEHAKLIDDVLGDFMMDMGYITDRNWWKDIPT
jgi:hypothetical protein